jgi:hypothetical protein
MEKKGKHMDRQCPQDRIIAMQVKAFLKHMSWHEI